LGAGMGLGVGASLGQAYNQMASEVRNGAQAPSPAQATPPAPPPSREAAPIDTAERIRLLRELATLRTDGVLSEDEFQAEKKKLLGS
jgi:hypothetical protein